MHVNDIIHPCNYESVPEHSFRVRVRVSLSYSWCGIKRVRVIMLKTAKGSWRLCHTETETTNLPKVDETSKLHSDCGVRAVGPPSASRRLHGGTPQDPEVSWVASPQPASAHGSMTRMRCCSTVVAATDFAEAVRRRTCE